MMKKVLFMTALLLGGMFVACSKNDGTPDIVVEPTLEVSVQESAVEVGEPAVFQFSSVAAEVVTFYSGEDGKHYDETDGGGDRGTIIETFETYPYIYNQPGAYKAVFVASNQDKRVVKALDITVTTAPEEPAEADFTVTWTLTTNNAPTKSDAGANDITAQDVYIGSGYRYHEFTSNGLLFSEGINLDGVDEDGRWVGRTNASNPNAEFTAPFRDTDPFQPVGYETNDMYVAFSIIANQDKDIKINKISIPLDRVGDGDVRCNMAYSLDGFSGQESSVNYILGEPTTPAIMADEIGTFEYNEEVVVPKGQSLEVRFMVWRRHSANSSGTRIQIGKDVVISGTSHRDPL